MKKELNYYDIHVKVMRKEKLTLEEKKVHFEKMVFKNNLMQKWYIKYDERIKKKKEKEKAWDELVKRVEQKYPNRKKIEIFYPRTKIFK